jgi:hypothetical protein
MLVKLADVAVGSSLVDAATFLQQHTADTLVAEFTSRSPCGDGSSDDGVGTNGAADVGGVGAVGNEALLPPDPATLKQLDALQTRIDAATERLFGNRFFNSHFCALENAVLLDVLFF